MKCAWSWHCVQRRQNFSGNAGARGASAKWATTTQDWLNAMTANILPAEVPEKRQPAS